MTDKPTLPPLPQPFDRTRNLFSDGQMDERYFAGYRKALEDAALVCDEKGLVMRHEIGAELCARAIRALGETIGEQG